MCGRYTLHKKIQTIADGCHLQKVPDTEPQYNIAPTQMVATILHNQLSDKREFQLLRWGLIPSWSKDQSMGSKLINARSETVTEKPSFRDAFKRRRCLVLADGFYEWQKQSGNKQPFYFCIENENAKPFAFAGLWSKWQSPEEQQVYSCTILTTEANSLLISVHDRMPVILAPEDYDLWLDPKVQTSEPLQKLLRPYPANSMTSYPVSSLVNNPKHNSPECITPLSQS
ncbi:MAG: SOS response-associated peptidase [Calothrix sp. SM1_7_51]|nr:SOS response-associated peptidase [Calothrix sp. SM1_7_51]